MPTDILKLPSHFNLEPELREQWGGRTGHQRCIEGHDELLLVLHKVPDGLVPGAPLTFWRRHDGRWVQEDGPGIAGVDAVLGSYEEVINRHFAVVNRADVAEEVFTTQRHAAPLLRSVRDLIKALDQVLAFDPNDRVVRDLRDRAREIELAADLLAADARVTLEFLRTRQSDELLQTTRRLNRIVDRLALLVLVFLPLAALGAFLAMSGSIPFVVKLLFWCVFTVGLLVTLSLLVPQVSRKGASLIRRERNEDGEI